MSRKQKKMLYRILIGIGLFLAAEVVTHLIDLPGWGELIVFGAVYLIVGGSTLLKAGRNILHGQIFDENFLMCLATIGAFGIQQYPEAVEVILFYLIGSLFESVAVGRSRKAVSDLMDICPDEAVVIRDGVQQTVSPEAVAVGETIFVAPGEKIPLDGVVRKGDSTVDTSALTGESIPAHVTKDSEVKSGCINLTGTMEIEVTKPAGESTAAKIMELVETSSSSKAKTENFITRFARYYTPCVVIGAVLLAVLPPLLTGGNWSDWIYRALTFLIVSCPCALVISVPLSFFGGIGCASKNGVLIKGSNYLEVLAKAKTVVMDKTGTLTQGKFTVAEQYSVKEDPQTLLTTAALAEFYSNHPIAVSLRQAVDPGQLRAERVDQVQEIAGKGIRALVDGKQVLAGNAVFLEEEGFSCESPKQPGTAVQVAIDGTYAGYILIADTLKPDAKQAITGMKEAGVQKTVMLTGDNAKTGAYVAGQLGLDAYYAQLMPTDKVAHMQTLKAELADSKGTLVFVGDGMNDAPVLAQSDVGVAMGGLGSDAAIEAADIVILDDQPSKLVLAMRIAKKTMRIAKENIVFALAVKAIVLLLGALGLTGIGMAVFADVGVSVLAILNACRALRTK